MLTCLLAYVNDYIAIPGGYLSPIANGRRLVAVESAGARVQEALEAASEGV
jgi:hypothetical protein